MKYRLTVKPVKVIQSRKAESVLDFPPPKKKTTQTKKPTCFCRLDKKMKGRPKT